MLFWIPGFLIVEEGLQITILCKCFFVTFMKVSSNSNTSSEASVIGTLSKFVSRKQSYAPTLILTQMKCGLKVFLGD